MTLLVETHPESRQQYFDVVHESMLIKQHVQLFMWLQGDLQNLLPHDALLVAHGDLANRKLQYEAFTSAGRLQGTEAAQGDIIDLIGGLFDRWQQHGRTVFTLETSAGVILDSSCQCNLHRTLRNMHSIMVQGIHDERTGIDVIYIMFRAWSPFDQEARRMFDILLPHIDYAARRVADGSEAVVAREERNTTPVRSERSAAEAASEQGILSERESEILHWVGNGKTNYEIGMILGISQFTVKNHLQRIFRKIDVSNRAQAISRIEGMNRQLQLQ